MKSFCLFCISGHRFDYYGAWLKTLIAQAYRIDARLIQGPEWLGRNDLGRWVIHAEMPEGATKEQIPEMLQSLLRERFHLMAHYGTAEQPAYTLVAGKNGVKLKPPREMDKSASSITLQDGSNPQMCRMTREEDDRTIRTTMTSGSGSGPLLSSTSLSNGVFESHTRTLPNYDAAIGYVLSTTLSTGSSLTPAARSIVTVTDHTGIAGACYVTIGFNVLGPF